ncbi:20159_t:CDS:2 [Rhizophagus irregularis]|nr:20159_t:CDS:2 [Rhizophagus irregularis]
MSNEPSFNIYNSTFSRSAQKTGAINNEPFSIENTRSSIWMTAKLWDSSQEEIKSTNIRYDPVPMKHLNGSCFSNGRLDDLDDPNFLEQPSGSSHVSYDCRSLCFSAFVGYF